MKKLRILRAACLAVALAPLVLLFVNPVWPMAWMTQRDTALPLGLCMALGLANAMSIQNKIQKLAAAGAPGTDGKRPTQSSAGPDRADGRSG